MVSAHPSGAPPRTTIRTRHRSRAANRAVTNQDSISDGAAQAPVERVREEEDGNPDERWEEAEIGVCPPVVDERLGADAAARQ